MSLVQPFPALTALPREHNPLGKSALQLFDYKDVSGTIEVTGIYDALRRLRSRFGLHPGAALYNDVEGANAQAAPEALVTDGDWAGSDGTLFLGGRLFAQLGSWITQPFDRRSVGGQGPLVHLVVIGHEFGHILQYRKGMSTDGPWQMEPHADFMAGWGMATALEPTGHAADLEEAIGIIFRMGDTQFNAPSHGTPKLRESMVRAGLNAGALDITAAYEKGRGLASL